MPFYFQAHCSQAQRCDLYCLAAWALQQERQMEGGRIGGGGAGGGEGLEGVTEGKRCVCVCVFKKRGGSE